MAVGHFLHVRAQMDRIHQLHLGMVPGKMRKGFHNIFHGLPVVFPAMGRDGNHLARPEIQLPQGLIFKYIIFFHRQLQRVYGSISGNENGRLYVFPLQVFRIVDGRGKMNVGQYAYQPPVGLFRIGGLQVKAAQARFYVADGDMVIKSCQSCSKGGGSVTMDQNNVRLHLAEHLFQSQHGLAGDGRQRLLFFHDIQIKLRVNIKNRQHLVQHLPVLGGNAHQSFDLFSAFQLFHQRAHLVGLRTGAEDAHYLAAHEGSPSLVVSSEASFSMAAFWIRSSCACSSAL